jgi:hypothetical protein
LISATPRRHRYTSGRSSHQRYNTHQDHNAIVD